VENKLPIGVKIPFSTKYGEWVIYAEPVTYALNIWPQLEIKTLWDKKGGDRKPSCRQESNQYT